MKKLFLGLLMICHGVQLTASQDNNLLGLALFAGPILIFKAISLRSVQNENNDKDDDLKSEQDDKNIIESNSRVNSPETILKQAFIENNQNNDNDDDISSELDDKNIIKSNSRVNSPQTILIQDFIENNHNNDNDLKSEQSDKNETMSNSRVNSPETISIQDFIENNNNDDVSREQGDKKIIQSNSCDNDNEDDVISEQDDKNIILSKRNKSKFFKKLSYKFS